MRTVEVVPYDSRWPPQFEATASELRSVFGSNVVAVHHIGSTAVPGLAAKPILDVLPVVVDLGVVGHAEPALLGLGYEPRGEHGLPGRRYFVREVDGRRTAHVHVYEAEHPAIARHLAVRDYLRSHTEEAARYGARKVSLAEQHPRDSRRYSEAKGPFVSALERRALAWATGAEAVSPAADARAAREHAPGPAGGDRQRENAGSGRE